MRRFGFMFAGILALSGLSPAPTTAGEFMLPGGETIYVGTGVGTGSLGAGTNCVHPNFGVNGGDAAETFEAALNGAPNNSTIRVCAGTYYFYTNPAIDLNGHTLAIIGAGEATTHLDGDAHMRMLNFYSGSNGTVYLRHLHFTHGGGDNGWGAGALFGDNMNFDIAYCIFDHNAAPQSWGSGDGGAIFVNGGSAKIDHVRFEANSAYRSGAIYATNASFIDIDASEFVGNSSTANDGAIGVYNSGTLSIRNSNFVGNSSNWFAGVLHTIGVGSLNIESSSFRGNHANGNGGAMDLCGTTYIRIVNSLFSDNTAAASGGAVGIFTGGICGGSTAATFQRNRFLRNVASGDGGAIVSQAHFMSIGATLFDRNTAAGFGGGLAYFNAALSRAGAAALGGNQFRGNRSVYGGAVYVDCSVSPRAIVGLIRSGNAFSGNQAMAAKEVGC